MRSKCHQITNQDPRKASGATKHHADTSDLWDSYPTSQRQAVISLIEKKGKDRLFINNWRPISLLNVDYKIFSKCIAERLKRVLPKLIQPTQTGYVKSRNSSDVIRTVMDIIEETDSAKSEGILLTIDFAKSF